MVFNSQSCLLNANLAVPDFNQPFLATESAFKVFFTTRYQVKTRIVLIYFLRSLPGKTKIIDRDRISFSSVGRKHFQWCSSDIAMVRSSFVFFLSVCQSNPLRSPFCVALHLPSTYRDALCICHHHHQWNFVVCVADWTNDILVHAPDWLHLESVRILFAMIFVGKSQYLWNKIDLRGQGFEKEICRQIGIPRGLKTFLKATAANQNHKLASLQLGSQLVCQSVTKIWYSLYICCRCCCFCCHVLHEYNLKLLRTQNNSPVRQGLRAFLASRIVLSLPERSKMWSLQIIHQHETIST